MKAWEYLLRRLVLLIPFIILLSLLTFTLSRVVPADPAALAAGPLATEDMREAELRRRIHPVGFAAEILSEAFEENPAADKQAEKGEAEKRIRARRNKRLAALDEERTQAAEADRKEPGESG